MFTSKSIYTRFCYAVAMLVVVAALASCSANKNTAGNRKYQAFITRYNIYYNGDKHFVETLDEMEKKYEDDYSRRVFMHPVEAKGAEGAPQPAGDFNRTIEKAQKAIQLRSIKKKPAKKSGKAKDPKYQEWIKREEYNPFLHNAWLQLGNGQYYNGDFLGAASTYFYISKHFTWLPNTVLEAKMMQALSYISLGWQFEAEMILTRIKPDELTNKKLQRLYNFAYADFYIHSEDYARAIPYLKEAIKGASRAQKTRLNFLLGQAYARLGDKEAAYKAYKAAGSASSATYRTKFNARIKQSEVFTGTDIEPEVKALRRMTRYDRNKDYLDQVYYAIGNLYLSRGDTLKAIENYEIANEKSTRAGIDKAMNQLQLGELYFLRGNYAKAQPSYAEAVPQLPTTYPDYANIKRRSDVLDELAVYSENVNLQDSLLRLAAMTPEQQLAVVEKIIKELKEKEKKEAEEARRQEYEANAAANTGLQDKNTSAFTINADNSWYFYNTSTKAAGKTEFQKRWGSRKLEDDWRRRNKASFNTSDFDAPAEADGTDMAPPQDSQDAQTSQDTQAAPTEHANDPHYPEYYLAQIPKTEQEKATSHEVIQEGLYNMGVILKDKLEDYGAANAEFGRLLADYPDNIYRLDTYYNLYLMNMRRGDTAAAERYRRLILTDFAESKYGIAMQDPNYLENLRTMDKRQEELYEATYAAYLANRNDEVHRGYETMAKDYPLSKIMPKFMFLDALAYVTEHKPEQFNEVLRQLLERYPDTDITPVAAAWLKGMAQGRELQAGIGGSNVRGMIWDMRLSNDSTDVAGTDAPASFTIDDNAPQLLVFTFDTDRVSSPALLFEIARHNFNSFVVRDYDLEPINFGRLGMIVVRGFGNMADVNNYRRVMAESADMRLPAGVRPIAISEANFDILMREGRSFEEYFHFLDEQNYIDAQAALLPAYEIEELPAEPAAAEPAAETVVVETVVAEPLPHTPAEPAAAAPAPAATAPAHVPVVPGSEGDDDPLLDD